MDSFDAVALLERFCYYENTLIRRCCKRAVYILYLERLIGCKTMHTLPYHAQALLNGFFKRATNSHHFAYGLHRRTKLAIHASELIQVPARNLTYHIIERRLKESRGGFGNRVIQFEKTISHAEFGCYEGQRIARSLGSQCRRTRETSIHLNHAIILRFGVKGVLHITFAHNTNMTNDLDGQRTKFMIFGVGQRLRRSNHYRLTGMDAKRIEILHIADGDAIIVSVSNYLILNLFPSLQALLYKHLRREREGFFCQTIKLFFIVAEART